MSTKHKSINPNSIDFSATSLANNWRYKSELIDKISEYDSIEWFYTTGELAVQLFLYTVLKWIESKRLHVPDDMEAHECDSLKWLDQNFTHATTRYFLDVYAMEESEVRND